MARDVTALRRAVHAACRELGLSEDLRRDVQEAATGKASMRDMTAADLRAVLSHLRERGWEGSTPGVHGRPAAPHSYQRLVYALWGELKRRGVWRQPDATSLYRFAGRVLGHGPKAARESGVIGLMKPEAMDPRQCARVIEALKDIGNRALEAGWDRR